MTRSSQSLQKLLRKNQIKQLQLEATVELEVEVEVDLEEEVEVVM